MTATSAQAFTTYTPTGGPSANFVNQSKISFIDAATGDILSCNTFTLAGTITSPGTSRAYAPATGNTGPDAGSLTSLNSGGTGGCSNPTAGPTTVTALGTWKVAITGDKVGSSYPAKLYGVKAYVDAANCKFYVGGPTDTATSAGTGWVTGKFDPTTQNFTADTTSAGLVISTPPTGSVCTLLGLLEDDPIDINGATVGSAAVWKNTSTPALTISNP
ncbi:hypothetical protein ACFJIY_06625 [Pimelobacter simplex]|uniref:hypothetical protein n=1 Tax=Nocardioides simplex TaxID=2045 RepID=UPI00366BB6B9